jgi:DNA-binding XRE family transcriptional regulator
VQRKKCPCGKLIPGHGNRCSKCQRVMKITVNIAERCLLLRRMLGWSQGDMAKALGVHRNTVCRLERGRVWTMAGTLVRFEILEKRRRKGK